MQTISPYLESNATAMYESPNCKVSYVKVPVGGCDAFKAAWDARSDYTEAGDAAIDAAKRAFRDLFGLEKDAVIRINFAAPRGSMQFLVTTDDDHCHLDKVQVYYVFPKEDKNVDDDEYGGRVYILRSAREFRLCAGDIRGTIEMFPMLCMPCE